MLTPRKALNEVKRTEKAYFEHLRICPHCSKTMEAVSHTFVTDPRGWGERASAYIWECRGGQQLWSAWQAAVDVRRASLRTTS